jgi:hypothetical protein
MPGRWCGPLHHRWCRAGRPGLRVLANRVNRTDKANRAMFRGSSPAVTPGPFARSMSQAKRPTPLCVHVWAGLLPPTTPFLNTTQYDRQYRHLSLFLQQ